MVNKISKNEILELANEIMMKIDSDNVKILEKEFNYVLEQMEIVHQIDTLNIEPTDYPIKSFFNNLFEDHDDPILMNITDIMRNAPDKSADNYILIPKVVEKND